MRSRLLVAFATAVLLGGCLWEEPKPRREPEGCDAASGDCGGCEDDGDCYQLGTGHGERCEGGRCVPNQCLDRYDCNARGGGECIRGVCLPDGCRDTDDCDDQKVCLDNRCRPAYGAGCSEGTACPAPLSCHVPGDWDGVCSATCETSADCGLTGPAGQPAECLPLGRDALRRCVAPCESEADCEPDLLFNARCVELDVGRICWKS